MVCSLGPVSRGSATRWRRSSVWFIFLVFLIFIVCFLVNMGDWTLDDGQPALESRIAELQSHLDHLRLMDQEKTKAFLTLKQQIAYLQRSFQINHTNGTVDDYEAWKKARKSILTNLSSLNLDISVPSIYDHLPHLLTISHADGDTGRSVSSNALTPAFTLTAANFGMAPKKHNKHLVIGVPTVQRPKVSYLLTTLRSLIENLADDEKPQVLIVVMLATTEGSASAFVQQQSVIIQAEFGQEIDNGLLEVMVPPSSFYPPDMSRIPPTFGDPKERMYWRTKQTLDYAYLMMYCHSRARYYMQLEDDVITKAGYLTKIKAFITQQSTVSQSASGTDDDWLLLEFSSLGFIGKLFRSRDIPALIELLLIYHRRKPVDWILDDVFHSRYCSPEKSNKICAQMKQKYRIRIKPSLFQHIGVHSSLKGKVQKLKEKDFGKPTLYRPHVDNPPANVTTSLKAYQKFHLVDAYLGNNFFWALLPQANDWIRFDFRPPVRIESFLFRSGNAEHLDDKFYNASVQILPKDPVNASQSSLFNDTTKTKDGFYIVAAFNDAGGAHATLNGTVVVQSLRIVVHAESQNWAILNEVWIKVMAR